MKEKMTTAKIQQSDEVSKVIPHKHDCNCQAYDFKEWLPHIARDFFWFDVQDVGSYQGSVYGVALYNDKIAIYEDYYGSCSGCGAWGEGGEPESQDVVIKLCTFYETKEQALEYIATIQKCDMPDMDKMVAAIYEADKYRNSSATGA